MFRVRRVRSIPLFSGNSPSNVNLFLLILFQILYFLPKTSFFSCLRYNWHSIGSGKRQGNCDFSGYERDFGPGVCEDLVVGADVVAYDSEGLPSREGYAFSEALPDGTFGVWAVVGVAAAGQLIICDAPSVRNSKLGVCY